MSLVPRWFSRLPSPKRHGFGNLFDDLEEELAPIGTYPTGLSVSSDDKNIYIEAHVPGLSSKDIEVSIDSDNVLWIKGEKKEEERDKKKKFYRRSQTSFSYCIPLWEEIDASIDPEAICKEGIMKVTFVKKKDRQKESKQIKVKE